jgi:hypothetical protein
MEKDFMIIQGYELLEDGSLDDILTDRLDFAISEHDEGLDVKSIIVAGKHGKRDRNFVLRTGVSEAQAMEEYLISRGYTDFSKIKLEEEGTNTWDCTFNAYNDIIKPNGYQSGIIVSSSEHLPRVMAQTLQIFPPKLYGRTSFGGPEIGNPEKRASFLNHELDSIETTLDEFRKLNKNST